MFKYNFKISIFIIVFFLIWQSCSFSKPIIKRKTWSSDLRLCTGSKKGNYYRAGNIIKRIASEKGFDIDVMATKGSLDNLKRISKDECDAAIIQADSLVYWREYNSKKLFIKQMAKLYREVAHLACNKEDKFYFSDFKDKPTRIKIVIVGGKKSGNKVTLKTWATEVEAYKKIKFMYRNGTEAIDTVTEGDAHCIFYISELDSPFAKQMNEIGSNLELIEIDDWDLNDVSYHKKNVYEFIKIRKETYPNLHKEENENENETDTIAIHVIMIGSESWQVTAGNGPEKKLMKIVKFAIPEIKNEFKDNLIK